MHCQAGLWAAHLTLQHLSTHLLKTRSALTITCTAALHETDAHGWLISLLGSLQAEMVFPEMLQDAALSRGDHHILLAAKYMQDVKFRSDSRNRVVRHPLIAAFLGTASLMQTC